VRFKRQVLRKVF